MEIRAKDKEICRLDCRTKDCLLGNENGYACPTWQYLGTMEKNTYCISCAECFRTCPRDNVALNLRFFGQDRVKTVQTRPDEAAMIIVMLAMTTFHGITMTPQWFDVIDGLRSTLKVGYLPAFTLGMFVMIGALMAFYGVFVWLSKTMARGRSLNLRKLDINYSYAFLPIALFYHFAHNSMHFSWRQEALSR